MIDIEQRQPGDGPDAGARAGDIEQDRSHAQVGAGLLERPGELAKPVRVHLGAREHGDRVGSEMLDDLGHALQRAGDGDSGELADARVPGDAGSHHGQAVVAVPAQRGDQVSDRRRVPDRDDPVAAPAATAPGVQVLAQQVPAAQVSDRCPRDRDAEVAPGQVQVHQVRHDDDGRRDACGCVNDPPEFVRAEADHAHVIATGQKHRNPPHCRNDQDRYKVDRRQLPQAIETKQGRHQASPENTHAIDRSRPAKIRSGPHPSIRFPGTAGHSPIDLRTDCFFGRAHAPQLLLSCRPLYRAALRLTINERAVSVIRGLPQELTQADHILPI